MADGEEFEFMGPWLGPVGIVVGLPVVCYLLVFLCGSGGCLELAPLKAPAMDVSFEKIYSMEGLAVYLGWMCFVLLLHLVLPGREVEGVKLADGRRLKYKMNGAGKCQPPE